VRERKNAATVGVAGGLLSGTYMKFADELAQVLDDGDKLRVLPIVTYGAASNLDDLLYLRGVDVAITQSDVFEYFRTQRKISNLEKRVNYIIRLPVSEMHVLARSEIKSLEDLRGKKVSFGPAGSASSLTGTIVFQRLGVQVEQVLLDNPTAMQKLKSGEISALVRVIGKPIDVFQNIPADLGLHFVSIPFSNSFADYYTAGELTRQDYPTLVGEGRHHRGAGRAGGVQLAEGQRSLPACPALRPGAVRQPGQVPAAAAASEVARRQLGGDGAGLDAAGRGERDAGSARGAGQCAGEHSEFASFLAANGGANLNAQQRDALFRQFEEWQQQRHAQPAR
jgi:hypothetical protein